MKLQEGGCSVAGTYGPGHLRSDRTRYQTLHRIFRQAEFRAESVRCALVFNDGTVLGTLHLVCAPKSDGGEQWIIAQNRKSMELRWNQWDQSFLSNPPWMQKPT